jgi:hypothetical protein
MADYRLLVEPDWTKKCFHAKLQLLAKKQQLHITSKEILNILAYFNASGYHKLTHVFVGKPAKHRAMKYILDGLASIILLRVLGLRD